MTGALEMKGVGGVRGRKEPEEHLCPRDSGPTERRRKTSSTKDMKPRKPEFPQPVGSSAAEMLSVVKWPERVKGTPATSVRAASVRGRAETWAPEASGAGARKGRPAEWLHRAAYVHCKHEQECEQLPWGLATRVSTTALSGVALP
ncbi:hypothetical protein P7K49_009013, partial [Saguinus oedipus]